MRAGAQPGAHAVVLGVCVGARPVDGYLAQLGVPQPEMAGSLRLRAWLTNGSRLLIKGSVTRI